jgi:nicotinamidase-related amidase
MDAYTRPDPERAALLTIDVQNDFTRPDAPATIEGTEDALPQMERLAEAFRDADAPIVHVLRLYREDGSNVDACRRGAIEDGATIVQPGTNGAELVEELKPAPEVSADPDRLLDGTFQSVGDREWFVYKPRWSAFFRTGLDRFLEERDVDTVVVCGCNFPNCPRTTVYGASARDYRIVFVPEATSGTYERGLDELANIDVALNDVEETIAWIEG